MLKIRMLFLVLLCVSVLGAQELDLKIDPVVSPDYGLAVTGAGMSICAIGTTMRQSATAQYNSQGGKTYISYESYNNRSLRLSTLVVGAVLTLGGILIQNRNRKRK